MGPTTVGQQLTILNVLITPAPFGSYCLIAQSVAKLLFGAIAPPIVLVLSTWAFTNTLLNNIYPN